MAPLPKPKLLREPFGRTTRKGGVCPKGSSTLPKKEAYMKVPNLRPAKLAATLALSLLACTFGATSAFAGEAEATYEQLFAGISTASTDAVSAWITPATVGDPLEVGDTIVVTDDFGIITYTVTTAASATERGEVELASATSLTGEGSYGSKTTTDGTEVAIADEVPLYFSAIKDDASYLYTVTSFTSNVFDGNAYITSLSFDADSITSTDIHIEFGTYAFQKCTALASVVFPGCSMVIGNYCFFGCSALATLEWSDGASLNAVTSGRGAIGTNAFQDCVSLKEVVVPVITSASRVSSAYGTGYCSFYGGSTSYWHSTAGPVATYGLAASAFSGCTSLEQVVFEPGNSKGLFAYWVGGANLFDSCSNLESVVFEATQPYYGNPNCSSDNGTTRNFWASLPNTTIYYAINYYATFDSELVEEDDSYASGRYARVSFARNTPTDALSTSDASQLDAYVYSHPELCAKEGYEDGVIPDPNEVAATLEGYDSSKTYVWHFTNTQQRREGLTDSCSAYLVEATSLSSGRVVSEQITDMYTACDYNMSQGTQFSEGYDLTDSPFDIYRYIYPSLYRTITQAKVEQYELYGTSAEWYTSLSSSIKCDSYNFSSSESSCLLYDLAPVFYLTSSLEDSFYSKIEVETASGTTLTRDVDYTISFMQYNVEVEPFYAGRDFYVYGACEAGTFSEVELGSVEGALLMVVTPTEASGLTDVLYEWVIVEGTTGTVKDLSDSSASNTYYNAARFGQNSSQTVFSDCPYTLCVSTYDTIGALLATGYAGLAQCGIAATSTADETYGLASTTEFYTNGGFKSTTSSANKTFSRNSFSSASAYSAALYTKFNEYREDIDASDAEGYTWGNTAVLVNPGYVEEVAAAVTNYAYPNKSAVFYTEEDGSVSDAVLACLKDFDSVLLVGATSMIPATTETQLAAWKVERLNGTTATTLSLLSAEKVYSQNLSTVTAAAYVDDANPIDSICAVVFTCQRGGVILAGSTARDANVLVNWLRQDYRYQDVNAIALFGRPSVGLLDESIGLYDTLCNIWVYDYDQIYCSHSYKTTVTSPTCAIGYTTYTCSACGYEILGDVLDPTANHTYTTVVTTTQTCTEEGESYTECSVCAKYFTSVIAADGHTVVEDTGYAATCTADGLSDGSHCSVCEEVLVAQEVINAFGHSYEAVVTAPTCVDKGYTTHTCATCQDSYVDTYIAATGVHDYVESEVAPTCSTRGYTLHACSMCEDSYKTNYVAVDSTAHVVEIYQEAVAATCTTAGSTASYKCTLCNKVTVASEEVAATGHTPGNAATCTTAQVCTVCNAELTAATGHTAGAAATCTTAQVCTTCNTELAAALGHTPGKAATCTVAQTCTTCGTELAAATGLHSWSAGKCSVCNQAGSAQTLKASGTSKTYKAKNLKKKAASFKVKVSGNKGKLTFKKTGGATQLTLSSAGKVKLQKKTKKGTYTLKVKVTSAASGQYAATSKTITIKVKVK